MTPGRLKQKLRRAGSSTPELDGQLLLAMITDLTPSQILAGDWQLSPKQEQQLVDLVRARSRAPIAYLRGQTEFYGLDFSVDQRVLIPRPESEDLVSLALDLGQHRAVYDVGCGSGCLGLAYWTNRTKPGRLYLIDSSAGALAVAQQNAASFDCPAEFCLKSVADLNSNDWQPESLVIANLPYLDQAQKDNYYRRCPDLMAEPPEALFAPQRGLGLYRQLWARLGNRPRHLLVEADWPQRPTLIAWAKSRGWRLLGHRGLALAFTLES